MSIFRLQIDINIRKTRLNSSCEVKEAKNVAKSRFFNTEHSRLVNLIHGYNFNIIIMKDQTYFLFKLTFNFLSVFDFKVDSASPK